MKRFAESGGFSKKKETLRKGGASLESKVKCTNRGGQAIVSGKSPSGTACQGGEQRGDFDDLNQTLRVVGERADSKGAEEKPS